MGTIVVVPTYNERQNLAGLVPRIYQHAPDAHILVVDDNSPDGTGQLADTLSQQYPGRLFVLHRQKKEGLGRAYVAGFGLALKKGYDVIIQMDADLSHDPSYLPALRGEILNADLVLGSRYLKGISIVGWDLKRLLLSKFAGHYVRFVLNIPATDPTGGFKCWRRTALESLDLQSAFSIGYLFLVEMNCKAYQKKLRVAEIPIIFYERNIGQSKMDWKVILESMLGVLRLRFGWY